MGPTSSVARGHRRVQLAVTLGAALAAASASQSTRAQDSEIDIRVYNRSWKAIEVRIYDQVCRQLIFEGEILHNAAVLVPGCPGQDGRVTIMVVDRFGHRQIYPGLSASSIVQVEFR